jgi:hypothetical protein
MKDGRIYTAEFKYPCGLEAEDKVTGFKGIITARIDFLYGCAQYGLTPKVNDKGETKSVEYFDEGRISLTDGPGIDPADVQVKKPGGDNRDAPKS